MQNNIEGISPTFISGTGATVANASGIYFTNLTNNSSTYGGSIYWSNATGLGNMAPADLQGISFSPKPHKPDYSLKDYLKIFSKHAKRSA